MNRRPRRNRKSRAVRSLVRENTLNLGHLVYPLFTKEGNTSPNEITSLPGNYIWSGDHLLKEIEECMSLGISNFILFPKVDQRHKDKYGTYGFSEQNFYLNIASRIKSNFPESCLISDVALDPYNIDGHDGIVKNNKILNDETLDVLQKMSLAQAQAGFDILGPSDMMDGRIGAIREALDESGFTGTSIMSYTAKYASTFYGPFRDALASAPVINDEIPTNKMTYQMDPANKREALIEAELDTLEGADFLMVKPAIHYLDIIHMLKEDFDLPIAAYHVSGECAMLLAACQNGWLELEQALPETLLSIHRAGASAIISYLAKEYALLTLRKST